MKTPAQENQTARFGSSIKAPKKVESRSVELGSLQGNLIEIRSGLASGDQIVAAGVHSLTDSMQVRPWTRERGL